MEENNFAKRLRKLRKKAEISQERLAEYVGVHGNTVSRWENGIDMPKMLKIKLIAEALHVSESELLNGNNEQSGKWALRIEVANDFKQEVIDLTKKVPCLSSITTTPNGGFLTLGGDYSLWTDDDLFKKLLSDLKKFRKTVSLKAVLRTKKGDIS